MSHVDCYSLFHDIITGDNPVIDLDEDDLQDELDRITDMDNPVQGFLNSEEFTSVDPSIQEPFEVYNNCDIP